jgi:CHAD domain-containing protein
LAALAGGGDALAVRVAATAGVAFGRDQHMLAHGGQMTTTERTAIRRRLQRGRTPPRPPWGARKVGHGSILAPLAATLAASVALGVGLAIARSERDRRRGGSQRKRDKRLGLFEGEQLAGGLRRMALAQVELALELLGGGDGRPDERAVHETRKAIKRLRALLRMLRGELGERAFERENGALRDLARELSATRDAAVMLATLDSLIERHPRKLARRRGVLELRRRVAAESDRMQRTALANPAQRAEVLGELHALRWRVTAWSLPAERDMRLIDADLERLYHQGRERRKRVARGHGERTLAMHRWRKRVKDLRYGAEMLERRGPAGAAGGRKRDAARLRELATRADELAELLGEEHDLAVLAQHLREGARVGARRDRRAGTRDALWRTGKGTRKLLLKLIAARRRELRRKALRKGRRLYGEKPRRFMRGVRRAYSDAAS